MAANGVTANGATTDSAIIAIDVRVCAGSTGPETGFATNDDLGNATLGGAAADCRTAGAGEVSVRAVSAATDVTDAVVIGATTDGNGRIVLSVPAGEQPATVRVEVDGGSVDATTVKVTAGGSVGLTLTVSGDASGANAALVAGSRTDAPGNSGFGWVGLLGLLGVALSGMLRLGWVRSRGG